MTLLGTVISTLEGPSTKQFAFVVSNPQVRKGQYVLVEGGEEGGLIAVVKDLLRANRYFERAESVSEYNKRSMPPAVSIGVGVAGVGATQASASQPSSQAGAPAGIQGFLQSLPVNEWEYVVADCMTLGALKKNSLSRSAYPPSPGAKVSLVEPNSLKEFLGFGDDGLHLGRLLQHEVEAKVDVSRLLQKHLAILGISGSGKSYFTSVLLEELLARKKGAGSPAVVVFDVHGEYVSFADKHRNPSFAEKTTVVKGNDVKIAFHKLPIEALMELVPDMSSTQARELEKIIFGLKKEMKDKGEKAYDLKDLMDAVAAEPSLAKKENVRGPLLSWLSRLRKLKLFSRADNPSLRDIVLPGKMVVFDLSELTDQKKKQVILAYFAQKLFKQRRKGLLPPFVLFVEEAHNFCKERAAKGGAISKGIIETIAREGRKFGACLCLISQRPVQLSTTALSQCNSYAIFKISNPYDLDHIQQSCEAIDREIVGEITLLKTGEGILLGEAVNQPAFIKVRMRKSAKAARAETLEQMAKDFEDLSARTATADDVEQFI